MSIALSTHAARVVTELEFVEEASTTYRTFPVNPAMTYLAEVAKFVPAMDFPQKSFRRLGSEDVFKHINTREDYKFSLEFAISETTFIKYAINALLGVGTIDRSLSIGMSIPIDNVENFIKITGARFDALRLHHDSESEEIRLSADMICSLIDDPSTSDYIGSGSHGTPGTLTPFNGRTTGAGFTWSGAIEMLDFNATFTRNLSNKRPIADPRIKFQRATMRDLVGDFMVEWNSDVGVSLEDDMRAGTLRQLVWTMETAEVITWTNAKLINLSGRDVDAEASETIPEKYGFVAESVNLP